MTNDQGESTSGTGAIVSAIVSAIALISALHPKWTWIVTLAAHVPEVTNILPIVLGAIGTVGAAVSHPPAWLRTPWDDLKFWVQSFFRRKVQP